jgi:putative transposase
VHGRLLFRDADDHRTYVELLTEELGRRRWSLFSWCLMPNHVHLLLRTEETDLGRGIKAIHERYATHVNRRHEEHGHVFGDRFHNRLVRDDAHFVATLRYIGRNPVAAGLCSSASQWRWSAHRALAGLEAQPFVAVADALGVLGIGQASQRASYVELVAGADVELVRRLDRDDPTGRWLVAAVDDHHLPIAAIAEALDVERSTVYRRLSLARRLTAATQGTVP